MINLSSNGKKSFKVVIIAVCCFTVAILITNGSVAVPSANSLGNTSTAGNTGNTNKILVLSFDDNRKGDFTYGKPILDKYGFKATFFIICGGCSQLVSRATEMSTVKPIEIL